MNLARFRWFQRLADRLIDRSIEREPDFLIRNAQGDYLRRWWIIPRNPICNLYLHNIVGSDDDRALHCHPWINCSVILEGGYFEVLPAMQSQIAALDYCEMGTLMRYRKAGDLVLRSGRTRHRLVHIPGRECWTLFITGPVYRRWGFWCRKGWVWWRDFVDARDKGRVGAGCEG